MPGIEFVEADAGGDADDVIDTGPRRPVPRWVWMVAALVAVAVGVGVLVSSRSSSAPSARTVTTAPVTAGPSSAAPAPAELITALTSDGTSLYWIAGDRLYRADRTGRTTASTTIAPTGVDLDNVQLVADPDERIIWVVSRGASGGPAATGVVEGFATADLTRTVLVSARATIGGAAVLNGALYVLAQGSLLRVTTTSTRPTVIAAVYPQAHDLVAVGGGLLFVEGGNSSAVGRWTPSGVAAPSVLQTVDNTLAVAGLTVFVLGTTGDDQAPELDTLSPLTLGVEQRGVATGLDGPLQLVAAGPRAAIVLGLGLRGNELACVTTADEVDAPGAVKVQALAVATSSAATVLRGQVFQADGGSVRPVTFNVGRCSV